MDARAKGRVGHQLTEQWLQRAGYLTYVCPHTQVEWREDGQGDKLPMWKTSGFNDAFPATKADGKGKEGGFDIIALSWMTGMNGGIVQTFSLWQVKKTKANPLTPKLKEVTYRSAKENKLPPESCFVIWWPDGVGLERGEPVIWCAAELDVKAHISVSNQTHEVN